LNRLEGRGASPVLKKTTLKPPSLDLKIGEEWMEFWRGRLHPRAGLSVRE